jgi:hypothetical protein
VSHACFSLGGTDLAMIAFVAGRARGLGFRTASFWGLTHLEKSACPFGGVKGLVMLPELFEVETDLGSGSCFYEGATGQETAVCVF